MNTRTLREIINAHLDRDDRKQSYLAKRLGRLPEQLNRWINGTNQIPFHIVNEIARILHMTPAEQVELFDAAGYPLPGWAEEYARRQAASQRSQGGGEAADNLTVQRLESTAEYVEYLERRLRTARHAVEERRSGLQDSCLTPDEIKGYRACTQTVLDLCRRRVVYRALTVAEDTLLLQSAEMAHNERLRTYNVRTLAPALRQRLHLLDFVIIDGKEAILALHHHDSLPADREMRLALRQPDLILLLRAYFDSVWPTAHIVKEGDELLGSRGRRTENGGPPGLLREDAHSHSLAAGG